MTLRMCTKFCKVHLVKLFQDVASTNWVYGRHRAVHHRYKLVCRVLLPRACEHDFENVHQVLQSAFSETVPRGCVYQLGVRTPPCSTPQVQTSLSCIVATRLRT